MTNSWAMLHDELCLDGEDMICAGGVVPIQGANGEDVITFDLGLQMETDEVGVVISEDEKPANAKDAAFWKYSEGKILREVEAYLSSTYRGHYVGEESKVQTLRPY